MRAVIMLELLMEDLRASLTWVFFHPVEGLGPMSASQLYLRGGFRRGGCPTLRCVLRRGPDLSMYDQAKMTVEGRCALLECAEGRSSVTVAAGEMGLRIRKAFRKMFVAHRKLLFRQLDDDVLQMVHFMGKEAPVDFIEHLGEAFKGNTQQTPTSYTKKDIVRCKDCKLLRHGIHESASYTQCPECWTVLKT